ncbi:MAG: hypothetical protein R3282_09195, partial [Rhodothermales bacterium]|nr:hypothetical protein [Rhodothermales bacterium]
ITASFFDSVSHTGRLQALDLRPLQLRSFHYTVTAAIRFRDESRAPIAPRVTRFGLPSMRERE